LDGTTWAVPTNPSDDDAAIITVTGALDENIQALYASYQDKLVWMKTNSFGAIYGSRRSNFTQRTFSDRVGVSSPETIQDCDGKLRWLGSNRIVWEFDGATFYKISELVDEMFSTISQGDAAARSSLITSESDWAGGSSTPTGTSDSGVVPGSIALSTHVADSQTDTTSADFGAGTPESTISTYSVSGAVIALGHSGVIRGVDAYSTDASALSVSCGGATPVIDQVYYATATYDLYSLTLRLEKTGSPGVFRVGIWNGTNGIFSQRTTVISSYTFNAATTLGSGPVDYSLSFGEYSSLALYTPLLSGSTYHITLEQVSGTCDGSNYLSWYEGSTSAFGPVEYLGFTRNDSMNYRTNKSGLATQEFRSRAYDIGLSTTEWVWSWGSFDATAYTPTGANLSYLLYTSPDDVTYTFKQFVTNHATPTAAIGRYVKYEAAFDPSSASASSVLYDATINIQQQTPRRSTYTTSAINIGNAIGAWGPITHNGSQGGGSYVVQFGTSSNGTDFTYSAFTNNSAPTVSTAPYAKFKVMFDVDVATDAPQVDDITLNWTDGSSVRSASAFYKQRYWLGAAVSSTTNNRVFVYDKRNQWQRYTNVNAAAMAIYSSNLYFGNSLGIYQAESGYNDNGDSITAYYQTPTLAPAGLNTSAKYIWLYTTTDNSDSTLSTTYQINGDDTDYSFGSSLMNTTDGIQNIRTPFSTDEIQEGRLISFKWSVPGTSFWRIVSGNLYFDRDTVPE
jgi:hypothetical protein